jgi:hypothetical protein
MYKFNASFRKSAAAVGEALGLEFISSKRQVENGTLMFNDSQTNVKYALYESGYVRRLVPIGRQPWGNSQTIDSKGHAMYQLNKVRKDWKHVTSYTGKTYSYYQNVRILANPEEQLGIFAKAVVNWRNKK